MHLEQPHQGFYDVADVQGEPCFYLFGSRHSSCHIGTWVTKVTLNTPIVAYEEPPSKIGIGERILATLALLVSLKDRQGNPAYISTHNLRNKTALDLYPDDPKVTKNQSCILTILALLGLAESRLNRSGKREACRWR